MNCKQLRDNLFDLAQSATAPPEAEEHLRSCAACSAELQTLRRTMSVLGEWKAPEPSPYFDSRLRARLREESTKGPGLFEFLRRPALAAAFTLLFFAGMFLFQAGQQPTQTAPPSTSGTAVASSGAVSDLETLDSNYELYADFELLDEMEQDGSQKVNP
ncbi:MAG: anti-sigma factor family protein [Nevskiales bacterium]